MLELRLFGYPAVIRDRLPVAFDTRKALALLAVLAVTGLEHSRDSLAAMLWPELDRTRARAALRRTLSVTTRVGPALQATPSAVRLDLDAIRCDVREFRALAASNAPGDSARAVAIASDTFLAGFGLRDSAVFDDWQLAIADALRDELSAVLARLVAEAVADGDLATALGLARRRAQIDRLSEPAHADLIRVLAWTGDRSGALAAYRALVRMLDRELGVPPLPETLLLQDAVRGSVLPPASATARSEAVVDRIARTLVGRERELAQLDLVWRDAMHGGGTAGIAGEPGIGKTALARTLVERCATDGGVALRIAGHAAERSLPYAAARDLLRATLDVRPALASELGRDAAPLGALVSGLDTDGQAEIRTPGDLQRLHEAVRAAVEALARDQRVLLVVDDAHLLDTPSAALLGYLARRPPRGVLLLAAWARGTGSAPLPRAVAEHGRVLTLPPLDLRGVTQLLGTNPGDAAEVLRRTRGVPLLVQEYATADPAVGSGAAVGARELVAARFEGAADLTRQVVGAVAVIGTVADPELVRAACGRDEPETVDAIEDAIAHGLLVERADRPGYDVPHELVRDVALAALSLARERLLHGRVADVFARRHAVDALATPAGAVALHLAQAGRDEAAATWYAAAAAQSSRVSAHAEALEQLRSALALGYSALDAHQSVGATLVRLGRYGEALVALDQAAALAEGDPARQAAIEHAIAEVHDRLGEWGSAQIHLESARALIAVQASDRHARILADLALVQHRLGQHSEAAASATLAEGEAAQVGDDAASAQANNVLGVIAEARGAYAEAQDRLTHAVELARGIHDLDLQIAALNNLSRTASAAGDTAAAMAAARSALDLGERQGDRHRLAALHSHMADLLHAAGREEEALEQLKSSAAAFAQVEGAQVRPEVWTLTEW